MQQEGHLSDNHQLLDIRTERGANAFLQAASFAGSYSLPNNVKIMSKICAKRQLNEEDKEDLVKRNRIVQSLAQYASPDVFREYVERSTVEAWLDHAIAEIKRFTTDRNWIATGKLPKHDGQLLNSCVSMMCREVPVVLAFERGFFHSLADFVKARKGKGRDLPCDYICYEITMIVSNAHNVCRWDFKWSIEKALTKLDATGILGQFIRCATVPRPHGAPAVNEILDELQTCTLFLHENVRPWLPCGKIILAIHGGRDGSMNIPGSMLNKLNTMIKISSSMDPKHKSGEAHKVCRNCGKADNCENFQNSLKKCARCQYAYYCSRGCQKADWRNHKETCKPTTKEELDKGRIDGQMFTTFCEREYLHIMVKMVEVCEQTGLSKDEMLVELDFAVNENGIVPAMQDKPEFNIAPVKDYIEGSRSAEPDWMGKNDDDRKVYERNLDKYLGGIKEQYRKLHPDQLLCLVRYEGRAMHIYSFRIDDPTTKKMLFTQEAVLAFKAYMNDEDDGPLSEILGPHCLRTLKHSFGIFYRDELPDEQMMRELTANLRMYEERYRGGLVLDD